MISRPLTDNVVTPQPTMPPGQREILYERFRNVIIGAGYNPQPILEDFFDLYMGDVPKFVAMLEEYERRAVED